jgi:phosphoribosyl-ATP pyrophosphohydrolase/phosphoribosyl-AMP cyclohydrolase
MKFKTEELLFDERGLIPAIVQDAGNRQLLMLAYMNADSLQRTISTGETWFWSRSRKQLWHKGETSGHTQRVVDLSVDCDGDAILITVERQGPACHTGKDSCFHNQLEDERSGAATAGGAAGVGSARFDGALDDLYALLASRYHERPPGSYTTKLFDEGIGKILAKVAEESQETIVAGRSETNQRLIEETSDLLYHLLVLLVQRGVTLAEIRGELARRRSAKTK